RVTGETMSYQRMIDVFEKVGIISRGKNIWEGGGYMWLPYGMRLKQAIFDGFSRQLDNMGYGPFQSPRILPREIIDNVIRKIVDLTRGTYWLAEKRDGEFRDSGRFANSTNDPVINYHLREQIRNGRAHFPFRGYSHHQIIRSHSVSTRPFLNSDENTDLFEAYSISETDEACEKEFEIIIKTIQEYFRSLGIAFLTIDQSMWGNKPVAKKVTSLQAFASPVKGSVRIATVYKHSNTFAKAFNVATARTDGKKKHVHQVGFGFWEGLIPPLLDQLRDKYGLCLPPSIAPIQISIIPNNKTFEGSARELASIIGEHRIDIDQRYNKPIQRRLKDPMVAGVPVRVTFEDNGKIRFSRRDTLEQVCVEVGEFAEAIPHLLKSISANYEKRARAHLDSNVQRAAEISELGMILSQSKLATFDHCGEDECGKNMENRFNGEFLGHVREITVNEGANCICCGNVAKRTGFFGKRAPTP
ncbi:MAG: hypothetical protein KKH52_03870, partial [Nanoarchaeota archaeon]|nr:hypothetical protein [Nanoarchaeota archaeon]